MCQYRQQDAEDVFQLGQILAQVVIGGCALMARALPLNVASVRAVLQMVLCSYAL